MLIFVSVLAPRLPPRLNRIPIYEPFVFEPFYTIEPNHSKRMVLKVILLCRITSKEAFEILRPMVYY